MAAVEIRLAERKRAKLRIGTSGPSGSGKTYSALLMARGMASDWTKVCLIDTENGSGELYSDLGAYNVIILTAPFTPERYIEAMTAAEVAGMEVIVVDSASHEWDGKGGCLEINEKLASAKFKGNTWAAWSETTPRHQKFIEALVTSSCHVVTTARSKTDTIQTDDKKIKKVGLKEIQREGFEYELTVNFNLDRDGHYAMASKDRTGLFIHRDPFVIDTDTGRQLLAWTEAGKEVVIDYTKEKGRVVANVKRLGFSLEGTREEQGQKIADVALALTGLGLSVDKDLPAIVHALEAYKEVESAQAVYAQFVGGRAPTDDVQAEVVEPEASTTEEVNPDDIPF